MNNKELVWQRKGDNKFERVFERVYILFFIKYTHLDIKKIRLIIKTRRILINCDFYFYANKNKNINGNIIPARANFQPRSLKLNFPALTIIVPVSAITIKLMANISE